MKDKKCPFLEVKTVIYCKAFPVKKMIPADKFSAEHSLCNAETFQDCSYYQEICHADAEDQKIHGFIIRSGYYYHPRHLWLRFCQEDQSLARMGIDDFAQKLIGKIDNVSLPHPGESVKENAPCMVLRSKDRSARMVAPVNGMVEAINQVLLSTPSLINDDPYCGGWLCAIRLTGNGIKDLFYGRCASNWLGWEAERLQKMYMTDIGGTLPDGGEAASNLSIHLDDSQWMRIIGQFLGN